MASTKEILKALQKLENDRKSDELCSPYEREKAYREDIEKTESKLIKLLESCPKNPEPYTKNNELSDLTYIELDNWFNDFEPVYRHYKFMKMVWRLDVLK